MSLLWGTLMALAGLLMMVCGSVQSEFFIYRILVARSRILWGDGVHRFYQISGLIITTLGVLWAAGMIWSVG